MSSANQVAELTGKDFEAFTQNSGIFTFIDFYTQWCKPCKFIAPIIDELAQMYVGKMKFGRLDLDKAMSLARKYNIMGVPNFIIFSPKGERVAQYAGSLLKKKFIEVIEKVLKD